MQKGLVGDPKFGHIRPKMTKNPENHPKSVIFVIFLEFLKLKGNKRISVDMYHYNDYSQILSTLRCR